MEDVIPMQLVQTQKVLTYVNVRSDLVVQEKFAVVGCCTVLFNFTITAV